MPIAHKNNTQILKRAGEEGEREREKRKGGREVARKRQLLLKLC